jgi:hypothetical protein
VAIWLEGSPAVLAGQSRRPQSPYFDGRRGPMLRLHKPAGKPKPTLH